MITRDNTNTAAACNFEYIGHDERTKTPFCKLSRSSNISLADWYRSSRCFFKHFCATRARLAADSEGGRFSGGGSSVRMAEMISALLSRAYGLAPLIISW